MRWKKTWALFFVWFLFGFQCPAVVQSQEKNFDKDHLVGVIEAHLARLEGWRSGDVLIRIKSDGHGRFLRLEEQTPDGEAKYVEGPDASSVVRQTETVVRLLFDFDRGRALVIVRTENETEIFDGLDETVNKPILSGRDGVSLLNCELEIAVIKRNGAVERLTKVPTIEGFLVSSGAPGIKHLGCSYQQLGSWMNSDLNTIFDIQTSEERISEVKHVGKDRYQLVYIGKGVLEGSTSIWEWDVDRQVPTKYWFGVEATGFTNSENTVEWKSIADNYLPVSSKSVLTNIEQIGARHYLVVDEGTVELHWFSFNSVLPDELFDQEIMRNPDELRKMINQDVFDTDVEKK